MWFGLINEIKFWYIRTFITRNCWMPKGNIEFSWADDDIPLKSINNFPYCVSLNKEYEEEIPSISKDQLEQFKKDLKKYPEYDL